MKLLHHGLSSSDVARMLVSSETPFKYTLDEVASVLAELAHESETYCRTRWFISKTTAALALVVGVARESAEPLRSLLALKATEILSIAFETMNELNKDKFSCIPLDAGSKRIDSILEHVDALTGLERLRGV